MPHFVYKLRNYIIKTISITNLYRPQDHNFYPLKRSVNVDERAIDSDWKKRKKTRTAISSPASRKEVPSASKFFLLFLFLFLSFRSTERNWTARFFIHRFHRRIKIVAVETLSAFDARFSHSPHSSPIPLYPRVLFPVENTGIVIRALRTSER